MPNRITAVQVWLSPFFQWKKGCELFAAANARDDDSSNAVDYIIIIHYQTPLIKKDHFSVALALR